MLADIAEDTADGIILRPKQPIDIEALLQWAVGRSGRLPWLRDGWRELTMNPYTAQLRRREVGGWTLTIACAGQRVSVGMGRPAQMEPCSDAARVLEAIAALGDPELCDQVRACARSRIRPDWMPGVVPQRVMVARRSRKKHRTVSKFAWRPCSPADVQAARDAYSRWHAALSRLTVALGPVCGEWLITGFAAPSAPWEAGDKKSS